MNTLNDITQKVLDTTTSSDPRVIAQEVLAVIPDEDLRECLGVALVQYVSVRVTRNRMGVPVELPTVPARPPAVSSKVNAIRDHWGAFLAERVQVEGTWKRVADCTVSDVEALAQERREVAARNAAHAKRFEKLAREMQAQGAATVADFKPGADAGLLAA